MLGGAGWLLYILSFSWSLERRFVVVVNYFNWPIRPMVQVLLSLFVGIVATSIDEENRKVNAEKERERRHHVRQELLELPEVMIDCTRLCCQLNTGDGQGPSFLNYRAIFDLLDRERDFQVLHRIMLHALNVT